MNVFPAIDLLNGQSVRLYQGDYQKVTPINADPVAQAKSFEAAGLKRIHIVDLDGAKAGRPQNQAVIQAIRTNTNLFIEVGGGIRNLTAINTYLDLGVNRIILGSSALKNPELVKTAIQKFGPEKIVIGIDGQNGHVATEGWLDQSTIPMTQLLDAMMQVGVTQFIVTDISRDGTLTGPNLELLASLKATHPTATIVASGGVANYQNLIDLKQHGLENVIVGKALFNGSLNLAQLAEAEETLC
ncbi:1-(5-phosphoribosyl)-5-[(5-phosphoribosylamino)methylideneamino]imidazole-4-carboxamide isomerase [Agrilactobacillus yilanensis]|uniref:1-(5-phosphoribosyl)-5-[(5-phosphoribosylamino)methylideneamino] imidazole-4-carboxamide isomerase n=1 Tax=Agrilactobacillus yilanensis TaxID=2485997 RepID=A0ABW4J6R6_9LACO|nr:1-(5-phosphoribosyl)-5-[(5-phosphoribosylamino)methylideneamino]imidazole-4-carboxamide isomerase [Agrilactobacillus yilanensis]